MFYNNLVTTIKSNGKILREKNGTVSIPFGSEYSILIKNLDSHKARVNISIDGKSVLEGKELIVKGNSQEEIKGFLRGDKVKNKFKFIQKNKDVVDHRGERIDDGIVRVEFSFEKPKIDTWKEYIPYIIRDPWYPDIYTGTAHPYVQWTYTSSSTTVDEVQEVRSELTSNRNVLCAYDGITVKGSPVKQSFISSYIGECGDIHVMVLKLTGLNEDDTKVEKAITTKTKMTCPTCGKTWKSNVNYCPVCGTYLK